MPNLFDLPTLRAWLEALGAVAWPAFVGLQVVQVVLFWVPGDLVQVVGGMVFGTAAGTVLSLVGVTLGSGLAFGLGRFWGRERVGRWLARQGWTSVEKLIRHRRFDVLLLVVFLLPFLPKDLFCYLAGLSHVKAFRFLWITTLARVPTLVLSTWMGTLAIEGHGILLAWSLGVGAVVGVGSFLARQRLLRLMAD